VDVQVFATARITLKPLVPVFPCFSKIVVSLMDKVRMLRDLFHLFLTQALHCQHRERMSECLVRSI